MSLSVQPWDAGRLLGIGLEKRLKGKEKSRE
jgi:hypothetical protein